MQFGGKVQRFIINEGMGKSDDLMGRGCPPSLVERPRCGANSFGEPSWRDRGRGSSAWLEQSLHKREVESSILSPARNLIEKKRGGALKNLAGDGRFFKTSMEAALLKASILLRTRKSSVAASLKNKES